jgi:hypothetical protein
MPKPPDAELVRQLLERGFYVFRSPPAEPDPEAENDLRPVQPPAASARIA